MTGPFALLPLAELQRLVLPSASEPEGQAPVLLLLLFGLGAVLLVLMRRSRCRRGPQPAASDRRPPGRSFRLKPAKNWILVDGSNVMHWEDNTPHLEPIQRVVRALKAQGFDPGVVFDANAGWKLTGRYLGARELGQLLGLPADQVLVVPKGSPADPWLLTTARDVGARIVTNDRYRDWADDHPEVAEPGFLIHGGLTEGRVWLEGMAPSDGSASRKSPA